MAPGDPIHTRLAQHDGEIGTLRERVAVIESEQKDLRSAIGENTRLTSEIHTSLRTTDSVVAELKADTKEIIALSKGASAWSGFWSRTLLLVGAAGGALTAAITIYQHVASLR